MKLKGINPVEQHVEKIVLGVVALVLLGVLTLQFAIPPKGVMVDNQEVPPEKALDPVLAQARRMLAKMNDPEPSLPDVSQQDIISLYTSKVTQATVPSERFAALGPGMNLGSLEATDVAGSGVYALPSLPEPTGVMAAAYRGSVHPSEWAASKALRERLGEEQPFDLGAVTVQAFIDGSQIRSALLNDADGDDGATRPLPPSWWRSGFEVLGVQLERERMLSDGSWGERTIVEGMPGRVDVLAELEDLKTHDPLTVVEMTRLAAQEMDQITKPMFYRTVAGERWKPPAAALNAGGSDNEQVNRLVRRAKGLERDAQTLRDAMDRESERGAAPSAPTGRGGGGGGGKGGRGGGKGGAGGARPPSRNSGTPREDPRIARLEGMLDQIDEIEAELNTLGYALDGSLMETGEIDEDVFGKPDGLFQNDRLALWSHDVSVVGGEVYRYRLRPVFNNPAFGREQALSEEQQELAASPTLPGPWSSWTAPVQALADEYYFVVNARETDKLGGGPQASVELYEFYYGYYRRATMTAEPGDQLYAEARVPDGLVLYDLTKLDQLDDLQRPPAPAPGRGRNAPAPRGGGKGGGRMAPGMDSPSDFDPRGRGTATLSESQDDEAQAIEGEPALRKLPIRVDAVLLDVAKVPGSSGEQKGALVAAPEAFRAFLTNSTGGFVSVRLPNLDEMSPVYQAVESSWRAGQRASAPDIAEAQEPRRPARREIEERRPPPSRRGGGGGGGSGG